MGACDFKNFSVGENAEQAFRSCVEEAQYDHGHAGYTGTIAEKNDFVMIDLPDSIDKSDMPAINEFAEKLIDDEDERVDDKWGPAGCIETSKGYLFFGWASE